MLGLIKRRSGGIEEIYSLHHDKGGQVSMTEVARDVEIASTLLAEA